MQFLPPSWSVTWGDTGFFSQFHTENLRVPLLMWYPGAKSRSHTRVLEVLTLSSSAHVHIAMDDP